MRRLMGLFTLGCVCSLLVLSAPLADAVTSTPHDTTFAPGAQVAATNWTPMPNATTSAPSGLDPVDNAVSCVNANFCMAVGAPAQPTAPPFAELWNGTTWSPVGLPEIVGAPGPNVQLAGVSCVTTSFCIAVGNAVINTNGAKQENALIELWNGTAWSVMADTSPTTSALY